MIGTYARALVRQLPVVGASGDTLPDTRLTGEAVVQRDRLREYAEVCGFRLSDDAPPTFPHVLAFPLAMRLMTSGGFPFGVIGVVHIANRIEQRRPAHAGETLQLRVWAEGLADHPKGRQFVLVHEAVGEGEDEPFWVERSTYLRRGGGSGDGKAEKRSPEPPRGGSIWRVPGDAGRRYAAVSGDRNPIHLRKLTARLFGQSRPIAHGMWLKARCLAALEGRVPAACEVEVEFKTPVALGSKVAFTSTPGDRGREFALQSPRDGRPHVLGRCATITA
jgi:acyl dehydratase